MEYKFDEDIKAIREILELTQEELADDLEVEQVTISRNESGKTKPSAKLVEQVYQFAFERNIRLNRLKEMLYEEAMQKNHKLLFHGSKSKIRGALSVKAGRSNNDFGQGFYTGETYEQAISFISNFDKGCVYLFDFDVHDLKCKRYDVDQEWMMTIAYYRGALEAYADHPMVKALVEESRKCDYITAPIADNRMFQIINSFIDGEITDEQCKHCLAATNLGYQYVFVSTKAIENLKIIERCYVSAKEKNFYKNKRRSDAKLGDDKVKLARIKYRGKGKYIDEILC